MSEATVVAHPNIALSKYWGKRAGGGNFPAVPSLSVTLDAMTTTTTVRFRDDLAVDRFELDGAPADGAATARVTSLLDRVRAAGGERRRAEVVSRNDFPTASGLASSASGFAALALAATHAARLDWDVARVSDLARRASASAARSLFGGFAELPAGSIADSEAGDREEATLSAHAVAPGDALDLVVLVCVTTEAKKSLGSTNGMRKTASDSPYFEAWLRAAPEIHERLRAALLARDLPLVGALAEKSALAMHASAMAAGVVYFSGATLAALAAVRALRDRGVLAFATVDAGPHVKVLTSSSEAPGVEAAMREVPGVLRIVRARPGREARVVSTGGVA
jgi:diphosphomevalonate decarboxylase